MCLELPFWTGQTRPCLDAHGQNSDDDYGQSVKLAPFMVTPGYAILALCSAQKFTAISFSQINAVRGPPQCPAPGHCVLTLDGNTSSYAFEQTTDV